MKKIKLFVLIIAMILVSPSVDAAVPVASNNLDARTCISFGEGFKTINALNGARGDYYYKSCYRYDCTYGVYNRANMVRGSGYRCNNGNGTPYVKLSSSGCKNYTGTCNTTNAYYCTTVEYIDCQKNADGSPYATTPPTTKAPTTARPTTTTKKKTTTTKKKTTTRRTTTRKVSDPTTTTTTTTTTTEPKKSNNTDLKRLVIFETEVKVDNKKSNYTIKAPFDITSLDIIAEPADEKATVEITGNENLPNEEAKVNINITAEDGTKRTVTITVRRYNGENSECTLANIFIEDFPLDFDKNTLDYTLKLPKSTKSLDLEVIPTDELAKYEIKGNEKLGNNSKIEIVVVAQDGTKCNYTIKIKKANNTWKYIILIILLVAALITASYFLYKYLKKSKGRYKYE